MKKLKEMPFVSALLVLINVILFLICTFTGDVLYTKGGLSVHTFFELEEYGRLVWSMFLHGDVRHIANNMLILFFLGALIEKEIGHIRYLILYFLSGIGGGMVSLLFKAMSCDGSVSIGASGAIFGLDGALLALILFWGRKMPNVTPARVLLMIAYSLYSGMSGENIDNAAHVGGLIMGFAVGIVICVLDKRKNERCRFEY